MNYPWAELNFWKSGEFQAIRERINDLVAQGVNINPDRKAWFSALARTPRASTKVVLLGQDPYPNKAFATGYAFSVPETIPIAQCPPTLLNIFKEYGNDLGYPAPNNGCLLPWADRGVLLWNTIPTCTAGKSLSHDWGEWTYLTKEIFDLLNPQGVVYVLMGSKAAAYDRYIDDTKSKVIYTSHPSPLAYVGGKMPKNSFLGSRMFTTVNAKLHELGKEPMDWRLS